MGSKAPVLTFATTDVGVNSVSQDAPIRQLLPERSRNALKHHACRTCSYDDFLALTGDTIAIKTSAITPVNKNCSKTQTLKARQGACCSTTRPILDELLRTNERDFWSYIIFL